MPMNSSWQRQYNNLSNQVRQRYCRIVKACMEEPFVMSYTHGG